MINVSTIMNQVVEWFEDSEDLDGYRISRGEFINQDAGQAVNGWIGVYRRGVEYDPRNLGLTPNNYNGVLTFDVVIQRTSMESGEDCEDAVEESVKIVLDRLVQIPRLYIDHYPSLNVEYTYLETDRKTMYFQGALITVNAIVTMEVN
jgi:hypothetical protein